MSRSLTEAEIEELELLLEAEADYQRFNKIHSIYPETGIFSRSAYPKHMECFEVGAKYRQRGFLGGNGCHGYHSVIETVDGSHPISELIGTSPLVVRSWDGESRCDAPASGVFLKEFAPAFRIHLDNGQWFDCSHTHRISTSEGWLALGPLIHAAGGLRCMRTDRDSLGSYGEDDRRGDEPPRLLLGNDLTSPPSTDDVQRHVQYSVERGDAAEHTPQYIRAYPGHVRLSSRMYDPAQVAALCEKYADPTSRLASQWSEQLRQAGHRLAVGLNPDPEAPEGAPRPPGCSGDGVAASLGVLDVLDMHEVLFHWSRKNKLFARQILPGQWPEESIDGALGEWIFFPSEHVPLLGGNRIVAVIPLGIQPILDLTVEGTACYWTAGVLHHNTGKTYGLGAYELTLHLTGDYPDWWTGLRFDHPIDAWACGDTRETVRDTVQMYLLGKTPAEGMEALGSGMIPRDRLGKPRIIGNTNGSCDFVPVRHKSGGWSKLQFKSYDQGRKAFQGTNVHFIWLDEEPPQPIFLECLQRGRGIDGRILLTFTPLSGHSDVVETFLSWEKTNQVGGSIITLFCSWDDVPHLDEQWKRATLAATPGYLRDARRRGIPSAGIGKVYTVEETEFVINPIPIPDHWRRCFGFDHGYFNTAVVWLAYDKDSDIVYVYSDYKRGEVTMDLHAMAILARGDWIPGVGDASARESDGKQIIDKYKARGIKLRLADKSVDAGIQEVLSRLSTGRLKVFSTCQKLVDEYRRYRYNDKQQIVKENDHILDALRYAIVSGLKISATKKLTSTTLTEHTRFG